MAKQRIIPRGIRNNNPMNIRIGNTWLGELNNPTETEFEQFTAMEYGLRAAFVILRRYIRRYKLNTVELIVSRWAPNNENDTKAYISAVCNRTGFNPDEVIDYADRDKMVKLVQAMCHHECGQSVDETKIRKGYDLA